MIGGRLGWVAFGAAAQRLLPQLLAEPILWPFSVAPFLDRLDHHPGPTLVANPPAGPGWLHEMKHDGSRILAKHDGSRILARKQGEDVDVWSRRGAPRA
jgi:ATP-dependent DNA ligase